MDNQQKDDDVHISFTVKELLRDIKGAVDNVSGKLDAKADRVEVVRIATIVDDHGDRLTSVESRTTVLETQRQTEEQINSRNVEWWKWVIPTVLAIALLIVGIMGLMHG